jgi:hypothetical protein
MRGVRRAAKYCASRHNTKDNIGANWNPVTSVLYAASPLCLLWALFLDEARRSGVVVQFGVARKTGYTGDPSLRLKNGYAQDDAA